MATRLTPQDASFYLLDATKAPMHIGSLAILESADGALNYDTLVRIVERRLCMVPRYRQKIRAVPFGLARPVWVDDNEFDITYHIRRSALPKPGTDEQLQDLVARLTSRPLDRTMPLWEMYLVEGLSDNRVAIFTKSHCSLVDGGDALEIGHVILDTTKRPRRVADDQWAPESEPNDAVLAAAALSELVGNPRESVGKLMNAVGEATPSVGDVVKAISRFNPMLHTSGGTAPTSPLNTPISKNRRFGIARTDLSDYRRVRAQFGCTVNDAILAVVTGALRSWLLSRNEPITDSANVRALVPMSVHLADPNTGAPDTTASEVSSFLVDLPVGEPNPVIRLSHIAHATSEMSRARRGVRARNLVRMSGFAPASLHAMSVRAAGAYAQRAYNLVLTNAPGPQVPMFIGGARMLEMYPVSPLLVNQALSIGLTSYNGSVYYGLNADRDAMADVDVLASLLYDSMEELLDASA